ncbi:MAG TPA: PQQ-binding-like beta-propeller repeat protein [Thermoanaerobaculia bacterium]|nr:PQQ-binding-like beta-propeller repeat protein [Thermoanaerobaculia bacterium]
MGVGTARYRAPLRHAQGLRRGSVSRVPAILPRAVTLWVILAPSLHAEDWPQFRGIHRDDRSSERIAHEWPTEEPPGLWRIQLGDGYSGVAVVAGRAYTQWGDGDHEWAGAFDGRTGHRIWEAPLGTYRADSQGGGPRSTPAVNGGRVFVLGALGRLDALDAATGRVLWTLIAADRHLLVLGDRCVIGLVEATATELREKAKAPVMTGRCWTAPSLADGVLYLRNQKEMVGVSVGVHGEG